MFCTNCGKQIEDEARFCMACGRPLADTAPSPDDAQATAHQAAPTPATSPTSGAAQTAVAPVAPSAQSTAPAAAQTTSMVYGGFWRRFVGAIIDGILLYLAYIFLAGLLVVAESATMARIVFDPAGNGVQVVTRLWSTANTGLPWLLVWLYFAGLEASRLQATPGKRLLGLRVTDFSGRPASLIRTTFRNGLKPLSAAFFMIGFLMAGVTARKQALHDMLAGCLVLRR